jgi:hypothetical protein
MSSVEGEAQSEPTSDAQSRAVADLPSTTVESAPSDDIFRLLVESVKDYAIFLLNPEGIIQTWN